MKIQVLESHRKAETMWWWLVSASGDKGKLRVDPEGKKFMFFATIESCEEYLLIRGYEPTFVDHYGRNVRQAGRFQPAPIPVSTFVPEMYLMGC